MDYCSRLLCYLLLTFSSFSTMHGQWVQESLPRFYPAFSDDNVVDFFQVGDHYYATLKDLGIYRREKGDSLWHQIHNADYYVKKVIDSTLYFHNNGGIYELNLKQPQAGANLVVYEVATDISGDQNFLYISNPWMGMYRINRNTGAMSNHRNGLPSYFTYPMGNPMEQWSAYSILLDGNALYLGTNEGLYTNTTGLGTWTQSSNSQSFGTVSIFEKVDGKFYMAASANNSYYFYESSDAQNWSVLFLNGSRFNSFAKQDSTMVLLDDNNNLHYSENLGQNWTLLSLPFNVWKKNRVSFMGDSLVVCSERAGVFFYQEGEWSWEGILSPNIYSLIPEELQNLVSFQDSLYVQSGRGIFKNRSSGIWEKLNPMDSILSLEQRRDTLYYSLVESGGSYRVKYSPDVGINWQNLNLPLIRIEPQFSIGSQHFYYHSTGNYARGWQRKKISDSWQGLGAWRSSKYNFEQMIDYKGLSYFHSFNGLEEPQVLDSNGDFHVYNHGLPQREVTGLFPTDSNLFAYCEGIGLYKTKGLFQGWEYASNGLLSNSLNTLIQDGNILFAATDQGIYNSSDEGKTWTSINGNLGTKAIIDVAVVADSLYILDDQNELWKSDLQNLPLQRENNQGPSDYIQIYPNPANDFCEVQVSSGQNLEEISIYTLDGTLLKKSSSSRIGLSEFRGGLYLIRVRTDLFEEQFKLKIKSH